MSMSDEKKFNFFKKKFAIPFGRYSINAKNPATTDKILIGREEQRAKFIDLLINMGARGSFLITGRRGMGKSTFVNHCLEEYQSGVYKRYLRSNAGKLLFDPGIALILCTVLILSLIVLSDLSLVLVQASNDSIFALLLLFPVGLLCLSPIFYSIHIVLALTRTSLSNERRTGHRVLRMSLYFLVSILTLFYLFFIFPNFHTSAPFPGGVNTSITMIGLVSFVTLITTYALALSELVSNAYRGRFSLLFIMGALITIHAVVPFSVLNDPYQNYFLTIVIWSIKALVSSLWLLRDAYTSARDKINMFKFFKKRAYYRGGVSLFVLGSAVAYAIASDKIDVDENLRFILIAFYLACFVICGLTKIDRPLYNKFINLPGINLLLHNQLDEKDNFAPSPNILFFFKAMFCFLFGAILSLPLWGEAASVFFEHGDITTFLYSLTNHTWRPEIFADKEWHIGAEELLWSFGILFLIVLFYSCEYEWIIRSQVNLRDGRTYDPRKRPPWEKEEAGNQNTEPRFRFPVYEHLTLPWIAYRTLLPTVIVKVNLGFEKLNQQRVMQRMLLGLRNEYHATFLSWKSEYAFFFNAIRVFVFAFLITSFSNLWFSVPQLKQEVEMPTGFLCDYFDTSYQNKVPTSLQNNVGSAFKFICSIDHKIITDKKGNITGTSYSQLSNLLITILSYEVIEIRNIDPLTSEALLSLFIHQSNALPTEVNSWKTPQNEGKYSTLSLRLYHVILLCIFLLLNKWISDLFPILGHARNLRQLDDLLDSLTSKILTKRGRKRWKPAQWIHSAFTDDVKVETEKSPMDPAAIEALFENIINKMQQEVIHLPFKSEFAISLPSPEITFVFDEVDKIGARIDPESSLPQAITDDRDILHFDRHRSKLLHNLLSDMKQTISAAQARFIFVGGRLLHDEWLADLTTRTPLLTSIFNVQIYLPSLITDQTSLLNRSRYPKRLNERIHEYLIRTERKI